MADSQLRRSQRPKKPKMDCERSPYIYGPILRTHNRTKGKKRKTPAATKRATKKPRINENQNETTNVNGSNDNELTNAIPQCNSNRGHVNNAIDLTLDDEDDEEIVQKIVPFENDTEIQYPFPEASSFDNFGYTHCQYIHFLKLLKAKGRDFKITNPFNFPITAGLLYDTLRVSEWMNGDIINLHFKLCARNHKTVHTVDSYLYNSFRFRNFDGLKSYYRLTNVSKNNIILFPFNKDDNHWTVYCANTQNKELIYYDSYRLATTKLNKSFVKAIFILIAMSDFYHDMEPFDIKEWKVYFGECPQQENTYDCGVFSCCTALSLSVGVKELVYLPELMYFYRHIIVYNIFEKFVHNDWNDYTNIY